MCRQSATVCLAKSPVSAARAASGIADRLAVLRDPRDRRGGRHPLVAVLLTACSAVLAGARSCMAIGQWAGHAPQDTLARLGARADGPPGVRHAPSTSTVRRVLTLVRTGGLADLLGCDPAGAVHLAVDGKCARGSRTDTAQAAHLRSAVLAGGRTVSQLRVPDKTTEVTGFTRLLAPFDLSGVVVTADALCRRRHKASAVTVTPARSWGSSKALKQVTRRIAAPSSLLRCLRAGPTRHRHAAVTCAAEHLLGLCNRPARCPVWLSMFYV